MWEKLPVRAAALAAAALFLAGAAALWLAADRGPAETAALAPVPSSAPVAAAAVEELAPPAELPRKSREEQRFARADRDDDGRITEAEYLFARRRNFDKLDADGDGRLDFREYAVTGREKFARADQNGDGALLAAEFATTAPVRRAPRSCPCPGTAIASATPQDE